MTKHKPSLKTFSTAGPIRPDDHYCIPASSRWDVEEIERWIREKRYFALHAPRQTGKTSCLLALMEKLNAEKDYTALYVNVEPAQSARGDVQAGMHTIVGSIADSARLYLKDQRLQGWIEEVLRAASPHGALLKLLSRWSEENDRPIVLFLDEVDALIGDTLVSFLRQIRSGYAQRPATFPQTIMLCGVQDVRDYRIHTGDDQIILGGSAFNIKSESLRLGNFSRENVFALYAQHTEETGQAFEDGVVAYVFAQSNGQPWLVNALGYQACFRIKENRDRSRPITLPDMMMAREQLIEQRDTHLDELIHQLREPRVHAVISELLTGEPSGVFPNDDDQRYTEDLGLIRTRPHIEIANPIYREIIPRALTWTIQSRIPQETVWYVEKDGSLNLPKLLNAFQQFFRENSEIRQDRLDYKEAAPQLLMQSFLQRIINGGGRIDREYGLGRRRTDLLIQWPINDGPPDKTRRFLGAIQRIVIELKIRRGSLETTRREGLEQTADYMDRIGAKEGYLVIFDRRPGSSWEEKVFVEWEPYKNYRIGVWGM